MCSNTEVDIKVAKFGKDESLPIGVIHVCAKCVGMLYDVIYCGSLKKLSTEKILKHKIET